MHFSPRSLPTVKPKIYTLNLISVFSVAKLPEYTAGYQSENCAVA